jgi:glycosyltransferase involved in cell wall biosynthesis
VTISLVITAKDDANCIHLPFSDIRPHVNEILLSDDFSKDDTVKIAKELGAKIYQPPKPVKKMGFAKAANFIISKATCEWILILDTDELLDNPAQLHELKRFQDVNCWALPRRKWEKYPALREEYEAYPDWQPKFFRNISKNRFDGEMHIRFLGGSPRRAYRGPHIEHLQTECRTEEKARHRELVYEKLAAIQGVEVKRGIKSFNKVKLEKD